MQRVSIGRWAQRHWTVLFAVLAIAVAGPTVYQLNGIFGSQDVASTPS
ncbi:MAG TPA: MmpS family transport accessory protein [Mycobacterium sp.]|nr:MmpS family transport accessory protein [Mycobacterium sp.]